MRSIFLAFGGLLAFTAIVLIVLASLPAPHTRLHYLIAGTTPTGIGLIAIVVWIERRRLRPRALLVKRATAG